MKTSNLTKTIKFSVLPLLLFLNVACVLTPDGDIGVVGGVGVDLTPQITYSDSSYVTVRVGPSFYASDAYLVAYNYCLDRGMYAYEYSSWAHSSSVVRDLRYDCRSSYIAPPLVYNIDRHNRFRYDYFHNHYYRNHRPGYHYRNEPSSGWWGKNNNDRYNPPTRPPHVNPSPGYTRDGRAVTPQSPWSYNPGKNNNRYQPRSSYQPSQPYSSSPSYTAPSNSSAPKNKWWGRSAASPSQPSIAPTPKLESPKSSGGSFWGGGKKSESSSSSPRYGSSKPSRPSRSDLGSSSGSGSSGSGSSGKPGWWGKN